MTDIRQSTARYEDWLRAQLAGDVVKKDLERKHEKMRESPFAFLRATYWRWAETVLEICPDLQMRRRCWRSATFTWRISAPGGTPTDGWYGA